MQDAIFAQGPSISLSEYSEELSARPLSYRAVSRIFLLGGEGAARVVKSLILNS
jgi:hypothetical protein